MNVHQLVRKPKLKTSNEAPIVSSRDGHLKSNKEKSNSSKEQYNNTTCTRNNKNKNCQTEKCEMWPKKPQMDMWPNKPAMLIQHKMSRKQVPQEDDKNSQSTEYYESK